METETEKPEAVEPEFDAALDIIDLRMECVKLAIQEEKLEPKAVLILAKYYFDFALTGNIVPYPVDTSGNPKLKIAK